MSKRKGESEDIPILKSKQSKTEQESEEPESEQHIASQRFFKDLEEFTSTLYEYTKFIYDSHVGGGGNPNLTMEELFNKYDSVEMFKCYVAYKTGDNQ